MKRISTTLSLSLFILENLRWLNASIAGVTYMDNFDFQERYTDVNECNPFYWHPLHLPEECFNIFDTLIRSRLQPLSPYRIFKQREEQYEFVQPYTFINTPIYTNEVRRTATPFEVLFELLRRDVQENPSAPTIEASPYFGSVAMYKQPVSFKSVTMIKKLARAYANMYPGTDVNTDTNIKEIEDVEKINKKNKINKKDIISEIELN